LDHDLERTNKCHGEHCKEGGNRNAKKKPAEVGGEFSKMEAICTSHFDLADGGNMFLRNVGLFRTTRRYNTENLTVHGYRRKNLKASLTPSVWK
jgi:hypothetical protein